MSAALTQDSRTERRRGPGRPWVKGQSGNPGGQPKGLTDVRRLAAQHTEEAIGTLVEIARKGRSEPARVAAASAILDRAYGKPAQTVVGDPDNPVRVEVEDVPRARVVQALLAVLHGTALDEPDPPTIEHHPEEG